MRSLIVIITLLLILTARSAITNTGASIPPLQSYSSNWDISTLAAVDRDSDLIADSLTKKILLTKKYYKNFPLSQLEDTVLAIINAVSPRLIPLVPELSILPKCKLNPTDTIAVFFRNNYKENTIEFQKEYGFRGGYFWETSGNGTQLYYVTLDSIGEFLRPKSGTVYRVLYRRAFEFARRRRGKAPRASESMCGLQIIVDNQMVKSIEGWYYY